MTDKIQTRDAAQGTLPWPSREVVAREIRRAMLDNPTSGGFNERAEKREAVANDAADAILARFAASQPPAAPVETTRLDVAKAIDPGAAWGVVVERDSPANERILKALAKADAALALSRSSAETGEATRTFHLMKHENQHGFGVSLLVYDNGQLQNGFTLITMPTEVARDNYVKDLIDLTRFELER